jgi:hypothetical protein
MVHLKEKRKKGEAKGGSMHEMTSKTLKVNATLFVINTTLSEPLMVFSVCYIFKRSAHQALVSIQLIS